MSAEAKEIDVFAFLNPLPQQAGRREIGGHGYPSTLPVPLSDFGHDFSGCPRRVPANLPRLQCPSSIRRTTLLKVVFVAASSSAQSAARLASVLPYRGRAWPMRRRTVRGRRSATAGRACLSAGTGVSPATLKRG